MRAEMPNAHRIHGLRHLWQEAFGDSDAFLDLFFGSAYSPARAGCLTVDDEVRAALYWFDCEADGRRLAYLYAIATQRAYRGRGLCRALMEDTHRHLAALGYDGALLVPATPALFDFYARMGYSTATCVCEYTVEAAKEGFSLVPIGIEEYFALRRVLLPVGGVVQEAGLSGFLDATAAFAKGDGVLLAYRREKDTVFGLELLGDAALAPRLLNTLGAPRGTFRTVGADRPFAMYLPLQANDSFSPSYFGLALD